MYIGIDLGGTNIAAGLVDDTGKIICKKSVPTLKDRAVEQIIGDMAKIARDVADEGGCPISRIDAVGIGCPGTVDNLSGEVVYSNNIVMDHVPMARIFQKSIDLPVNLENDANAAAYGEYITYHKGKKSFVFMTLGTGVGGGIILDGRIYRGFNGAGAEIGHITVVKDGIECTCGKRGCLEAYGSVTALIRQTREAMASHPESIMNLWEREHGHISGRTAFRCAEKGDESAVNVRDTYIGYVAEGVVSIINVLQPAAFAIGGGISREGDGLLLPIKEYVYRTDFNKFMEKTEICIAGLFGDAGIVGAAMAAVKQ